MCDEVCEMTLTINQGEALWTQKYRPNNIDECILSAKTKAIFKGFLQNFESYYEECRSHFPMTH